MFGLEPWHIVLLLAVVLIIFGPKRLPEIGKNLGESIREFRKATTEFGDSVKAGAASPTPEAPPPVAPAPVPPQVVAASAPVASVALVPPPVAATQPVATPAGPEPPNRPAATGA